MSWDDKKESVSLAVGVEPTPQGETLPPFLIMALPTIHFHDAKIHNNFKLSATFSKIFCFPRKNAYICSVKLNNYIKKQTVK